MHATRTEPLGSLAARVSKDGAHGDGFAFAGRHGGGEERTTHSNIMQPCSMTERARGIVGDLESFDAVGADDGIGRAGLCLEESNGVVVEDRRHGISVDWRLAGGESKDAEDSGAAIRS